MVRKRIAIASHISEDDDYPGEDKTSPAISTSVAEREILRAPEQYLWVQSSF